MTQSIGGPGTQAERVTQFLKRITDPRSHPWVRRAIPWLLSALALTVLYGSTLSAHIRRALDPARFNNDARQQIYPFFRYSDPELFTHDYASEYYLDCMPIGYRGLYKLAAWFGDVVLLSKLLPYALLLVTLIFVMVTARRLAGHWAAFASGVFLLGSVEYLARMGGGLPRTFAFPLMSAGIAILTIGRLRWLAVLVPVAAAFYPVASVMLGLSLAMAAVLLPAQDRGDLQSWSMRRRVLLVAASAVATLVIAMPNALASRDYGPVITPSMLKEYPEAGPGGRYDAKHRPPYASFFKTADRVYRRALDSGKPLTSLGKWIEQKDDPRLTRQRRKVLLDLLTAALLIGSCVLVGRSSNARRAVLFAAAAFAGHAVARSVAPYFYLPFRYVGYPVTLFTTIGIPVMVITLAVRLCPARHRDRLRAPIAATFALLLIAALGGSGSKTVGIGVKRSTREPVMRAVAKLPKDALVAGWPRGIVDDIPYVARRPILVGFEVHQAFHVRYAETMRRRMRALIDAYFARDLEPLLALRDEFEVTHLLVHLPHLGGKTPRYFAPFKKWATAAKKGAKRSDFEVTRQLPHASVFRNKHWALLDLSKLR